MNIQSDLTILDKLLAINLNISLWSARRKMTPEDFGGATLPPEDLATLGSKRIANPDDLKIFSTLKTRAFNYLDRHGVRFMSGWAIPEARAGVIIDELIKIRDEFFQAKDNFLGNYETSLNDWLARHRAWANIIRASTVSADYVRSRLDFRWQMYKVSPLTQHEDMNAVTAAGLAEEVTGLAKTLFTEVARTADEIWRRVYMGKTEVTHKALSPLKTLREKLIGLSFVEPHVSPVAEIIGAAIGRMPPRGNIAGPDLLILQGLVCLLRDSETLIDHSQMLIAGCEPASVLDSLLAVSPGMDNATPSDCIAAGDDMPDLPQIPLQPIAPNIPSMGLW